MKRTLPRLVAVVLGLASLFALAATAHAQTPDKMRRVGVLIAAAPCPPSKPFLDSLAALGWVEGRTIVVDCVSGLGRMAELPALARDLVARHPNVIVVSNVHPIHAAMDATKTIPIVMLGSGDPVREGIIKSLARPGGNVTGLTGAIMEFNSKRVELLKELVPNLSRLAVVLMEGADKGYSDAMEHEVRRATARFGGTYEMFMPARTEDFAPLFKRIAAEKFDGVFLVTTSINAANAALIGRLSREEKLPTVGGNGGMAFIEAGGLLNYSASPDYITRRAASYVDRILKGADPASLPVEEPSEFVLGINLGTAKALGLTVPPALLVRATEVIE